VPKYNPPSQYDGEPRVHELATGTRLTRIFTTHFGATGFNPTLALVGRGGRFDATDEDVYAYLYAASDDRTAVSETLLRDLQFDDKGRPILPKGALAGRSIGWIRTTSAARLISLRSGADLRAVAQDAWLTTCSSADHGDTRRWAHAIRRWAPTACGFVWHSRLEPDGYAYVFFGDAGRCPDGLFVEEVDDVPLPPDDRLLSDGLALAYVREILADYGVTRFP